MYPTGLSRNTIHNISNCSVPNSLGLSVFIQELWTGFVRNHQQQVFFLHLISSTCSYLGTLGHAYDGFQSCGKATIVIVPLSLIIMAWSMRPCIYIYMGKTYLQFFKCNTLGFLIESKHMVVYEQASLQPICYNSLSGSL